MRFKLRATSLLLANLTGEVEPRCYMVPTGWLRDRPLNILLMAFSHFHVSC